jgi:uncharacterized protein YhbP (UPF0306 family)
MVKGMFANVRALHVDGASLAMKHPSADRVERSVSRVLVENPLCAWATVTFDGRAHVHTGYFAYSAELDLFLLSHPGSLHCRNIATNPSMSVAVFASAQKWTDPGRGIQLFGTCKQVSDEDAGDAERVYSERFPAYAAWKKSLEIGDPALEYRFYRFVPGRVKILDEAEFGDAVWIEADIIQRTSQ